MVYIVHSVSPWSQGDALRFDCSFDESFSYADISTNPWNCLQINTMAVVPKEGDSAKPTYTADVFRNINDVRVTQEFLPAPPWTIL